MIQIPRAVSLDGKDFHRLCVYFGVSSLQKRWFPVGIFPTKTIYWTLRCTIFVIYICLLFVYSTDLTPIFDGEMPHLFASQSRWGPNIRWSRRKSINFYSPRPCPQPRSSPRLNGIMVHSYGWFPHSLLSFGKLADQKNICHSVNDGNWMQSAPNKQNFRLVDGF